MCCNKNTGLLTKSLGYKDSHESQQYEAEFDHPYLDNDICSTDWRNSISRLSYMYLYVIWNKMWRGIYGEHREMLKW